MSILLPAFNAAQTIADCLRSIQRQSFPHWRCIVVNDGSTDETARIVSTFGQADPRIHLCETSHIGLVSALQLGLNRCDTPYVARMDADDLMHSERLKLQVERLAQDSSIDAVASHVRLFPRRNLKTGLRNYESWLNTLDDAGRITRDAFIECPVAHPSLTFRTKVLRKFGYHDEGWPEDYDLVLRLLLAGKQIGTIPRRLLSWRNDAHRLSMTDSNYGLDRFVKCKTHYLCEGVLAKHDQYILWGYGKTGRTLSRSLSEHGKSPSYIIELHPGRLGNKIMGAPVVPPTSLPRLPRGPILVSVAKAGPRQEVRDALRKMGFVELRDYVCVA